MGHFSPRSSVFGKAPYQVVISVSSLYDMSEVGKLEDRKGQAEKIYMKGTKRKRKTVMVGYSVCFPVTRV
jgi:hypothetical protein